MKLCAIILSTICFATLACSTDTQPVLAETNQIDNQSPNNPNSRLNLESLDSLWNYIIFEKGGCLTGGQYVRDGQVGFEACVLSRDSDWKLFLSHNTQELAHFLVSKIHGDTIQTEIHTCPFMNATEGEIAVYALQHLYLINWYDFNEFVDFRDREITHGDDNHQAWLQEILAIEEKRNILIHCWIKKIEKRK